MKQKIVMKVNMPCEKCRTKALKTASTVEGVSSVAIEGEEKDRVVVVGEEIDSAALTMYMRKHVGDTDIMTVQEFKPPVKIDAEKIDKIIQYQNPPYQIQYHLVHDHEPTCIIL